MKLVHELLSRTIEFRENINNVLVIEEPTFFTKIVEDFNKQEEGKEGGVVLSENDSIIDLSKNLILITDLFNISINDKKILTKLYKIVKEEAYESANYDKTMELQNQIISYIEKLTTSLDYHVEYDLDIDFTNVFKILNLKLVEDETLLIDKLINYIKIINDLYLAKCVVIINLKAYLTKEELKNFYNEINYRKFNVLLIENKDYDRIETEKVYIVDKDLCEI